MTRVSIALCVCHGARFLGEQLSSLRAQSRLPEEVVIGDGASQDESVAIIEKFSAEAPFPVRVIRNKQRLGVRGNFEKVISHCANEIIALCDQDDVWLPEKLDVLAYRLEHDANAVAVFSDASVVDEKLKPLGYTMWEHVGFSARRRKQMTRDTPWRPLFKDPVVTGATLAFRKRLVDACLPIPESWVHDAWIAQIAAAHGKILALEEPLVLYGQHSANVIGGKRLSLRSQLRRADVVGRRCRFRRRISGCGRKPAVTWSCYAASMHCIWNGREWARAVSATSWIGRVFQLVATALVEWCKRWRSTHVGASSSAWMSQII